MTKLQKLGGILHKCYFEGKLPKCATPYDVAVLQCCYNELSKGGKPEFIEISVKTILENIGYITAPKGIGWIVIC
jgi:hypothetical protein